MRTDAAGFPAADEGPHPAGDGPWWAERWWFGWWAGSAGEGGGFVELTLFPNRRHGWYRCALVRPGEALLVIVDHDVPVPRVGLEFRSHGLWADHTVEASHRQWTVANEAFALALDDPDELIGRGYGTPQPFALDAEWYAAADPVAAPGGVGGYTQAGELEGTVELGGGRRLAVDGMAARAHTWGPVVLPPAGAPDGPVLGRVPDRWPDPFAAVVDDVLTPAGWSRWLRPAS